MRAVSFLALLPVLAAPLVFAEPAGGGGEEVLELRINEQETGATLLVRRDDDGTLLLRAEDLAHLRIRPPQSPTVLLDGVAYFRIDGGMGAHVVFDATTQSVNLTLPSDAFVTTVASVASRKPGPATVSPGAFLNYNLSAQQVAGEYEGGAMLELGLFNKLLGLFTVDELIKGMEIYLPVWRHKLLPGNRQVLETVTRMDVESYRVN